MVRKVEFDTRLFEITFLFMDLQSVTRRAPENEPIGNHSTQASSGLPRFEAAFTQNRPPARLPAND